MRSRKICQQEAPGTEDPMHARVTFRTVTLPHHGPLLPSVQQHAYGECGGAQLQEYSVLEHLAWQFCSCDRLNKLLRLCDELHQSE